MRASVKKVFDIKKLEHPPRMNQLHPEAEEVLAEQARLDIQTVMNVIQRQGYIGVEAI